MMLRIAGASVKYYPARLFSSASSKATILSADKSSSVQDLIKDDVKKCNPVPVFKRALLFKQATALKDANGEYSYSDLASGSKALSNKISELCGTATHKRITFLCPNDASYVITQWAAWMSGNVAVPLSPAHPTEVLKYFISDSQSNLIISTPDFHDKIKPIADQLNIQLLTIENKDFINEQTKTLDDDQVASEFLNGDFYKNAPAMILYTSGTTSKPKGVVLSHSSLEAQISCLTNAWKITNKDTILHSLPLHHVHGIINAMLAPLNAGGKVIMLPKFETEKVWSHLLNINMPQKDRVNLYMGVPTIYNYLIQEYDKLFKKDSQMAEYIKHHCQNKIRLMVSGSSSLPKTTFQRWREMTGHNLLERYGMTEIGMALSNTLVENEYKQRLPGFVGHPLPGVQVRITNAENDKEVLLEAQGEVGKGLWSDEPDTNCDVVKIPSGNAEQEITGSLQIKGANVFTEYWKKPDQTKKEFTDDGWFITGDSVAFDTTKNSFKILGRNSCDIIKSRGYKISALEMETKLLENNTIEECAVIGIPDEVFGQKVVALVKCRNTTSDQHLETIAALNKWCQSKFASYSVPSVIKIIEVLPKNQMGKVNKADLVENYVASQREKA